MGGWGNGDGGVVYPTKVIVFQKYIKSEYIFSQLCPPLLQKLTEDKTGNYQSSKNW